jgi:hypothetical protein
MKSKFFLFVAVIALGMIFTAKANALDFSGRFGPCTFHPEICGSADTQEVIAAWANRDSDSDGVKNMDDACPSVAGEASAEGCPDADLDGVADDEDRCRDVAADTADGCPVAATEADPTEPDALVGDKVPESDAGAPATEKEDITSCSLVQNGTGSFNSFISIAVFAISLAPLTIRRRIKK